MKRFVHRKRILVAPLNWGLGHATRCIPIINALLNQGFEPVLASDGVALELLKKEFPQLTAVELPSYKITYSKKGYWFRLKMLFHSHKLLLAVLNEKRKTKQIVEAHNIEGLISDNRLGVRHKTLPSVIITHQLRVLSGNTTWFTTQFHQFFIKKFNECWVPDNLEEPNLTGKLSHLSSFKIPLKYLGPISRFSIVPSEAMPAGRQEKYSIMVLLSGPEPQRTMLEKTLLKAFSNYKKPVLFVRGKIEPEQTTKTLGSLTVFNFMTSHQLETAINQSGLVISRSGYTTVMDLAKLGKKAFFIPTPGQTEQEYLAKKLDEQDLVPTCSQNKFSLKQLKKVESYKGLTVLPNDLDLGQFFRLFKGK